MNLILIKFIILMKLFSFLSCNFCYNKNNFNYLLLNLQWPTTFVAHNLRRVGDQNALTDHKMKHGFLFTIHGLWPQKTNGIGPTNCNHSDYLNIENIKRIPKIEKYWRSFGMPTERFWRFEWNKHGTCAAVLENMTTAEQYFKFCVEKAEDFDNHVYQSVIKNEFKPSNNDFYSASKIKSTIENLHGFKVNLKCWARHVIAVEICFDTDLKPIDCISTYHHTQCNGEVILPSS